MLSIDAAFLLVSYVTSSDDWTLLDEVGKCSHILVFYLLGFIDPFNVKQIKSII